MSIHEGNASMQLQCMETIATFCEDDESSTSSSENSSNETMPREDASDNGMRWTKRSSIAVAVFIFFIALFSSRGTLQAHRTRHLSSQQNPSARRLKAPTHSCDVSIEGKGCDQGFVCVRSSKFSSAGVCLKEEPSMPKTNLRQRVEKEVTRERKKLPKYQEERELCSLKFGDESCEDGLECVPTKLSGSKTTGVCLSSKVMTSFSGESHEAIPKLMEERELCDISLGDKACQKGLACIESAKDPFAVVGVCIAYEEIATASTQSLDAIIPKRAPKNNECDITYGKKACERGLSCVSNNGKVLNVGICIVDIFENSESVDDEDVGIPKFQGKQQDCDLDLKDQACESGLSCVKSSKSNEVGICVEVQAEVMMPTSMQITEHIPKRQGRGESCDITLENKACERGLTCVSGNTQFIGKCKEKVEEMSPSTEYLGPETLPQLPALQEEGNQCDIVHGSEACLDGLSCLLSRGGTNVGTCIQVVEPMKQHPKNQAAGRPCSVERRKKACESGASCVPKRTNSQEGICVKDVIKPQSELIITQSTKPTTTTSKATVTTSSTIVSIPGMQNEGHYCNPSLENSACIGELVCMVSEGSVAGICVMQTNLAVASVIQQKEGQLCDTSYGWDACYSNLSCVATEDTSGTFGRCLEISRYQEESKFCDSTLGHQSCAAGLMCKLDGISSKTTVGTCVALTRQRQEQEEWYIKWEVDACVKSCDSGPNCGGLRPEWQKSQYSSAVECCDANLHWKRYKDCVQDIESVDIDLR